MPNTLAYIMLLLWPVICLVMFRRMALERAIVWSILGGYLALPPLAEFDLPLVPDMDKYSISTVSAFVICVFVLGKRVSLWPHSALARLLSVGFVLGAVPTVMTNADPLLYRVIEHSDPIVFLIDQTPGLNLRDLLSVLVNQVIVLLPFFMARQYLSGDTGLRELLLALVVGGLIYSLPALVEIRLSPQINVWVYGFFQHSFEQMMRNGGFRPLVFLPHGLWLAFFLATAVLSAAALSRTVQGSDRVRLLIAMVYLAGVLVLCKSLASMLYAAAFLPVILLTGFRTQIRLAMLCALLAVSWPMLRNAGVVPLDAILSQAEAISPERAASLDYRFTNEERLLERARERSWFGWGGWGRNLVHDSETGDILTIPDGRWIIVFGTFGWVGYIAEMGLLAAPLFLLGWRRRATGAAQISPHAGPVAILLAITMSDMLLNATLTPYTWLCAGAILGHAERLRAKHPKPARRALFPEGPAIGRTGRRGRRRTMF